MKNLAIIIIVFFLACAERTKTPINYQKTDTNTRGKNFKDKMAWWKDAKFGMFIHWGVYSVPAGIYKGNKIEGGGEWIMLRGKIPVSEYKTYAQKFNPKNYNPEKWVKLAKEAGMKYLVITSKHHDGFALYDSKVTDWDVVDATPYGKDLLSPIAESCRKQGIKLGLYYSQVQDWCHPGGGAAISYGGRWDSAQNGTLNEYFKNIAVLQVNEIMSKYKPDILWWDTHEGIDKEKARDFISIIDKYPELITNNRLCVDCEGDIQTPEQHIPATGIPGKNWEACMTMNDTWGYKSYDQNWKSSQKIIKKLIDIVSKGGNFLLNVGPTSDGLIPEPSVKCLKEVGKWTSINGEAIYQTTAGPFHYLPWGKATRKGNKLYLCVYDWPEDGELVVPLQNNIKKASLLVEPKTEFDVIKSDEKSTIILHCPAPDLTASVIVAEIEGEPDVLPILSTNQKSFASSEIDDYTVANLFDGKPDNKWKPKDDDKEKWAEIELMEETTIQALAVVEPWHPWDNMEQKLALQYKTGDKWITAIEVDTKGTGITVPIEPIKARNFRLNILDSKDPTVCEFILFRDY